MLAPVVDVDEQRPGLLGELRNLPLLDDLAPFDDDDAVTGALHVAHEVRGEHDADAELPACAAHELQHLLASARIESGSRLVEQHHDRIVYEGLGKLDALLHTSGVLFDMAVPFLVESDVAEDIRGTSTRIRRGNPAHLSHVSEELGCRDRAG